MGEGRRSRWERGGGPGGRGELTLHSCISVTDKQTEHINSDRTPLTMHQDS